MQTLHFQKKFEALQEQVEVGCIMQNSLNILWIKY